MTDALFFTLNDVQVVRKVSVNIDDFDLYAQEVQRNFVQKLLGTKLYLALVDDLVLGIPQTTRFVDLVDGSRYDVGTFEYIQRGLKLYSSYIWLHGYTMDSEVQITPIGTQLFKDEAAQSANKQQAQAHYMRSAEGIEDGILHFLNNNRTTYPEFDQYQGEEPAEENNFSFKVLGNKWNPPTDLL